MKFEMGQNALQCYVSNMYSDSFAQCEQTEKLKLKWKTGVNFNLIIPNYINEAQAG